ncbi:MAG TPA: hypothetical protein VF037_08135 [Gemmatimonadales bacterium]
MRYLAAFFLATACTAPSPDGAAAAPRDTVVTPPDPASAGPATDSVQSITGVVRHFDLEGGFFAIRGDDGVTYDPSNLAEEFRQDGLRVRARLRLRPDMGGIHMVGPIVDIIEIQRDSAR